MAIYLLTTKDEQILNDIFTVMENTYQCTPTITTDIDWGGHSNESDTYTFIFIPDIPGFTIESITQDFKIGSRKLIGNQYTIPTEFDPIEQQRKYTNMVNEFASNTILSKVPLYKQNNLIFRMNELTMIAKTNILTPEQQQEYSSITDVWQWINTIRQESNKTNELIKNCLSLDKLTTTYSNFCETVINL